MRPTVRPALDPLAQKATIDALEAQRAAYRRFARTVEGQRMTLNDGDGDRAAAVASDATRGFTELEEGARRLRPMLREVRDTGSADQLREMQRQMQELMAEARAAEAAIQNLSLQLEAWRDAYGRQLAELGLPPGSAAAESGEAPQSGVPAGKAGGEGAGRGPYVQPGFGRGRGAPRTSLIDKTG
jgi:hypothetical protein